MKIRTLLLFLIYIIIVLCLVPVLAICMLTGARNLVLTIGKQAMRFSRIVLGLDLDVSGAESVDRNRAHIFMPNHLSFLDGPLVFMLIPQPVRVILKKEVFRLPVIGQGMRFVEFIPVDRKGSRAGRAAIERAARLMREKGYSFLIFPEGTRSRDGNLQKFKRGGFFLALQSGVPIVPVSIQGTYALMPRKSFFIRRGRIRMVFHQAVPVKGYGPDRLPELMDRVRTAIQSGLGEKG